MTTEKKEMTVQEAGRLGGTKLARERGPEYMASIGKKGGTVSPTKFTAGDPRTASVASMGGKASGGNFANNPARAAEAGRKGGTVRAQNRLVAGPDAPKQPYTCSKCRKPGHNRKTCPQP